MLTGKVTLSWQPVAGALAYGVTGPGKGKRVVLLAGDEDVTIASGDAELRVRYADIATARTVVDWDAELKRSAR